MSPWHLTLITISMIAFSAATLPDTSRGPISEEEGKILWEDGRKAALEERCADAVPLLARLVDRYPAHEGYIHAHLLLGDCLLKVGDARAALGPLRYFAGGSLRQATEGSRALAIQGLVLLGRAYLANAKHHEAYLTALEIGRRTEGKAMADDNAAPRVEALLIKGRALLGMGREVRAQAAIDDAKSMIELNDSPALKGEEAWSRMKLILHRCASLGVRGPLNEAQARNQIERRGTCLLDATLQAREALLAGDARWAKLSEDSAREAAVSYRKACQDPPDPPKSKKERRSAGELKKYHTELALVLSKDASKAFKTAIVMLDGWRKDLSDRMIPFLGGIRDSYVEALKGLSGVRAQAALEPRGGGKGK